MEGPWKITTIKKLEVIQALASDLYFENDAT